MTTRNAITLYLQTEDEKRVGIVAKKLGLNKSSFCRLAALKMLRDEERLIYELKECDAKDGRSE